MNEMEFSMDVIAHKDQRYPTVGDWQIETAWTDLHGKTTGQTIHILVSSMGNPDYEFLVGIHELIEAYLCQKRGIKEEEVTKFDIDWEANRAGNEVFGFMEPGADPKAPYFAEHMFATNIEKQLATELGVDWDLYDKTIQKL